MACTRLADVTQTYWKGLALNAQSWWTAGSLCAQSACSCEDNMSHQPPWGWGSDVWTVLVCSPEPAGRSLSLGICLHCSVSEAEARPRHALLPAVGGNRVI